MSEEQEQLRAQRLATVRARVAEADAEVERRFGQRLTRSLATRAPPGGAGGAKERN